MPNSNDQVRILFVEDSPRLRRYISGGLRNAGYSVDVAADGTTGLSMAQSSIYDVIVLDLMLPGRDGMEILRDLRDAGASTHVLVLTAKDTVQDRVAGLNAGADHYVIKPFAFAELVARIRALTRREPDRKHDVVRVGDLEIDLTLGIVSRNAQTIDLTARDFALIACLASEPGKAVSRKTLETEVFGAIDKPASNVVDSGICVVRRKIDLPGKPSLIETRKGVGYLLRDATSGKAGQPTD